jgi:hypothetical protein
MVDYLDNGGDWTDCLFGVMSPPAPFVKNIKGQSNVVNDLSPQVF